MVKRNCDERQAGKAVSRRTHKGDTKGCYVSTKHSRLVAGGAGGFAPTIEKMQGQEILYHCHVMYLMRVESVEVSDSAFHVVATPIRFISTPFPSSPGASLLQPLKFGGAWSFWYLVGSGIKIMMATDMFYPDPADVAAVKAAADRGASYGEILGLLGQLEQEQACED